MAASGGHHGDAHGVQFEWGDFAMQALNVGVLLFILIKYAGPAINKSLRNNHDKLKADLADAAEAKLKAEADLAAQQQRVENLEKEIADLKQSIADETEKEKVLMMEEAETRARQIEDEAQFLIDQRVKEAELSFRTQVAEAAAQVAEKLLRAGVTDKDQGRMVGDFVSNVADASATPGRAD